MILENLKMPLSIIDDVKQWCRTELADAKLQFHSCYIDVDRGESGLKLRAIFQSDADALLFKMRWM